MTAYPAIALGIVVSLTLAGCAAREVLFPKSAVVPAGIDLSGRWRLREEQSNEALSAAERRAAETEGIRIPSQTREQAHRPKQNRDSLVHVFLETGSILKITQTLDGLFISFDRAVVEEYRFGENRIVSVGPVEADRVSGWEAGAYVIETLDDEGNKLTERYSLREDDAVLVRSVSIFRRDEPTLSVTQQYDRLP